MRSVHANEKIKRVSMLFGNGGLALLIAGVSRLCGLGLDISALAWILISAALMWVSWQFNELLVPEDEA